MPLDPLPSILQRQAKPLHLRELLELVSVSPEPPPAEGGVSPGIPGSRAEAGGPEPNASSPGTPTPSLGQQERTDPRQTETPPPPCPHLSKWHQHPGGQAASVGIPHDASPSSPLPSLDLLSPPSLLRERPSRPGPASPSSLLQAKGCPHQGAPARDPQNQILTQPGPRSPTQGPVGLSSWASLASPGLTRGRSVCHVACCPHPAPRRASQGTEGRPHPLFYFRNTWGACLASAPAFWD